MVGFQKAVNTPTMGWCYGSRVHNYRAALPIKNLSLTHDKDMHKYAEDTVYIMCLCVMLHVHQEKLPAQGKRAQTMCTNAHEKLSSLV